MSARSRRTTASAVASSTSSGSSEATTLVANPRSNASGRLPPPAQLISSPRARSDSRSAPSNPIGAVRETTTSVRGSIDTVATGRPSAQPAPSGGLRSSIPSKSPPPASTTGCPSCQRTTTAASAASSGRAVRSPASATACGPSASAVAMSTITRGQRIRLRCSLRDARTAACSEPGLPWTGGPTRVDDSLMRP